MFKQAHTSVLHNLVGRQLSAVVFVRDYLQLQFDGGVLSLYVWPSIELCEVRLTHGQPGYRDLLCDQIGKVVSDIRDNREGIALDFVGGSVVRALFRELDGHLPEAAQFQDFGSLWTVWHPDDLR